MSRITATPIAEPVIVACPACRFALLTIDVQSEVVHGQVYFLRDGDTLPIYNRLAPEARERAWDARFLAGHCPACQGEYVVFETAMIATDAAADDPSKECDQHLIGNRAGEPMGRFTCTLADADESVPSGWTMARTRTPFGLMDEHMFGPFLLTAEDPVHTAAGISACRADGSGTIQRGVGLVMALWADLAAHNAAAQSSSAAATASESRSI